MRAKAHGSDLPPEGGGRNPERDFHGQKRCMNDTHGSSTDPDSMLYRKAVVARRPDSTYMGHVLMENRHGLVVHGDLTDASRHGGAGRPPLICWPNARAHSGLRSVATSFTTPKALLRNFANSVSDPACGTVDDTNRRSAIDANDYQAK